MLKKVLYNPFAGMAFCVLYLISIRYLQSIYEVKNIMVYGRGYQFPLLFDIMQTAVMWLPFMILLVNCTLRKEWKLLFESSKKLIQRYWTGFAVYLAVLLFVLKSIGLGDMHYDISFIHVTVDMTPSFGTYVVMEWLYHMFESINSILFLVFAPFLYCVIDDFKRAQKRTHRKGQ